MYNIKNYLEINYSNYPLIPTNPNSDNALMYGGLSSAITGGNFLEGAAIGLVVTALNHALHAALDPDPKKQQEKNVEKIRKAIAEKAKKYSDEKSLNWYSVESPKQCNIFCQDIANEVYPSIFPKNPKSNGYYSAGEIGNPNVDIPNRPVVTNGNLQDGDIVAYKFNYSNATGHSGIIFNDTKIGSTLIYAGSEKYNYIVSSKWIYCDPPAGSKWVIRRYTPN